MVEIIWLAATGAAGVFGYAKSRRFVKSRLRFVDGVRKPYVPVLAGGAAAAAAARDSSPAKRTWFRRRYSSAEGARVQPSSRCRAPSLTNEATLSDVIDRMPEGCHARNGPAS